jgi:hypothetical protein
MALGKCALTNDSSVSGSRWRQTTPRKDLCNANALRSSGTRSSIAAAQAGALPVPMLNRQGLVSPNSNSLNSVAAEETKLSTTVVVESGKRRIQQLELEL